MAKAEAVRIASSKRSSLLQYRGFGHNTGADAGLPVVAAIYGAVSILPPC